MFIYHIIISDNLTFCESNLNRKESVVYWLEEITSGGNERNENYPLMKKGWLIGHITRKVTKDGKRHLLYLMNNNCLVTTIKLKNNSYTSDYFYVWWIIDYQIIFLCICQYMTYFCKTSCCLTYILSPRCSNITSTGYVYMVIK